VTTAAMVMAIVSARLTLPLPSWARVELVFTRLPAFSPGRACLSTVSSPNRLLNPALVEEVRLDTVSFDTCALSAMVTLTVRMSPT
jgi:hypothetical protein